jgi:hypothetical protein
MKNIHYFLSLLFLFTAFFSCTKNNKISINKVVGSPAYETSKLTLKEPMFDGIEYSFNFDVKDYNLGEQTNKEFTYNLANSSKGQHIHFIVNNGPYSAHYSKNFIKDVKDGDVVLAFLSRSYHESVKNKNAYILTEIGDNNNTNLSDQFLFYSRPKGKYSGNDTKNLLLDFYLVNTEISSTGNKVRATINDSVFLIDEWAPYYIQGLPFGEITIKLELIDSDGNLIKSQFNPSIRTITLEK